MLNSTYLNRIYILKKYLLLLNNGYSNINMFISKMFINNNIEERMLNEEY